MTPQRWARLLSDDDLRLEILELSQKCKSTMYDGGLAGQLYRAALNEHRKREAQLEAQAHAMIDVLGEAAKR